MSDTTSEPFGPREREAVALVLLGLGLTAAKTFEDPARLKDMTPIWFVRSLAGYSAAMCGGDRELASAVGVLISHVVLGLARAQQVVDEQRDALARQVEQVFWEGFVEGREAGDSG